MSDEPPPPPPPQPPVLEYHKPDPSHSMPMVGLNFLAGSVFSLGILSCLGAMTRNPFAFFILLGATILMLSLAASALRQTPGERIVACGVWTGMIGWLLLLSLILLTLP
jgi:hypothetical protein